MSAGAEWVGGLAVHLFLLWCAYDIGFDRGYNRQRSCGKGIHQAPEVTVDPDRLPKPVGLFPVEPPEQP